MDHSSDLTHIKNFGTTLHGVFGDSRWIPGLLLMSIWMLAMGCGGDSQVETSPAPTEESTSSPRSQEESTGPTGPIAQPAPQPTVIPLAGGPASTPVQNIPVAPKPVEEEPKPVEPQPEPPIARPIQQFSFGLYLGQPGDDLPSISMPYHQEMRVQPEIIWSKQTLWIRGLARNLRRAPNGRAYPIYLVVQAQQAEHKITEIRAHLDSEGASSENTSSNSFGAFQYDTQHDWYFIDLAPLRHSTDPQQKTSISVLTEGQKIPQHFVMMTEFRYSGFELELSSFPRTLHTGVDMDQFLAELKDDGQMFYRDSIQNQQDHRVQIDLRAHAENLQATHWVQYYWRFRHYNEGTSRPRARWIRVPLSLRLIEPQVRIRSDQGMQEVDWTAMEIAEFLRSGKISFELGPEQTAEIEWRYQILPKVNRCQGEAIMKKSERSEVSGIEQGKNPHWAGRWRLEKQGSSTARVSVDGVFYRGIRAFDPVGQLPEKELISKRPIQLKGKVALRSAEPHLISENINPRESYVAPQACLYITSPVR